MINFTCLTSLQRNGNAWISFLSVVAPRKDLGDDYRDHVLKYTPIMRLPEIGLGRAADYLESWVSGTCKWTALFPLNRCFDYYPKIF